jgi:hypothetical protein
VVEQDLFLTMGGLAWALDIRKKRRADGTEVPVHWDDYTPLLIAKPVRFEFDALVRDGDKMRTVTEMLGEDTLCDPCDHAADGGGGNLGGEKDFFVNVRESPVLAPIIREEVNGHERNHGSVSAGEGGTLQQQQQQQQQQHSVHVDKRKSGSPASGSWPASLLVAQGPMIVR